MPVLKKIKALFSKSKKLKKYFLWILIPIAILTVVLSLRGCSHMHLGRKKTFLIGRESTLKGELLGRDKNLMAFTNDLLAAIAEENGIHFQWLETNPTNLMNGLDKGSYDFVLTSLRPNIVNQERYDFSEPIFAFGPVLIVRQASQIISLKEMGSKPIGIAYGFNTIFNAVRTPGVNVYNLAFQYYHNMNRALEDLKNDQIDGVIMNAIPAYAVTHGLYAGRIKVVTPPLDDEGLRIVSLKSSGLDDIIDKINEGITTMRRKGTYMDLINKWNLVDPETQYWQPNQP